MGFCTRRHFLLSICFLQLISTVERQVFDFMGYMWIPILVNFFQIIFVIFGFFGTFQYRPKYIISYSIWNFILLAWNIFLICLYLDIGILNHKESKVLKLDPDSASWWMTNGPGCQATFNTTASIPVVEAVTGCLLNYVHVEVFHAGFQCLLSFLGFVTGLCLSKSFMEEDDSFEFLDGNSKNPQHLALQPMYVTSRSIPSLHNQSTHSSFNSFSFERTRSNERRKRTPRKTDLDPTSTFVDYGPYDDNSASAHSPLYSFSHSKDVGGKFASGSRIKPKPTFHVDQIRKIRYDDDQQRTKSHDRLIRNESREGKGKSPRPKSLYSNVFLD